MCVYSNAHPWSDCDPESMLRSKTVGLKQASDGDAAVQSHLECPRAREEGAGFEGWTVGHSDKVGHFLQLLQNLQKYTKQQVIKKLLAKKTLEFHSRILTKDCKIAELPRGMRSTSTEWILHRKRRETKQQASMLPGPAVPGCYLVYFRFLCDIYSIHSVCLYGHLPLLCLGVRMVVVVADSSLSSSAFFSRTVYLDGDFGSVRFLSFVITPTRSSFYTRKALSGLFCWEDKGSYGQIAIFHPRVNLGPSDGGRSHLVRRQRHKRLSSRRRDCRGCFRRMHHCQAMAKSLKACPFSGCCTVDSQTKEEQKSGVQQSKIGQTFKDSAKP